MRWPFTSFAANSALAQQRHHAGDVLDRDAAAAADHLDAAFAAFMEDKIGSLEVGKQADFIVLDRDIMRVPEEEVFQIVVEQTWLDGKPVFVRESSPLQASPVYPDA